MKKKEETKQERKKTAENRYPYCKDETKKKENDPWDHFQVTVWVHVTYFTSKVQLAVKLFQTTIYPVKDGETVLNVARKMNLSAKTDLASNQTTRVSSL